VLLYTVFINFVDIVNRDSRNTLSRFNCGNMTESGDRSIRGNESRHIHRNKKRP
jgi:hypothetical protein